MIKKDALLSWDSWGRDYDSSAWSSTSKRRADRDGDVVGMAPPAATVVVEHSDLAALIVQRLGRWLDDCSFSFLTPSAQAEVATSPAA